VNTTTTAALHQVRW
jgi:hypothetical protein